MAVLVDGDGFTKKVDGWNIDWDVAATWPLERSSISTSNRFFVNTMPRSDRPETHHAFELAARISGFEILHRAEKQGESSRSNGYSMGSRALIGAALGYLAPHIDVAVVHDNCEETTNAIKFVLNHHAQIRVIMATSKPCDAARILESQDPRFSIIDPNKHRGTLEFTGNSEKRPEIFRQRILIGNQARGTAKIIDGASFTNIARSISQADTIFDSKKLCKWTPDGCPPRTESHYVSSDRGVISTDKKLAMRIWKGEGWAVKAIKIGNIGGRLKAMDDGLIGAMIANLASRFSHVVLFSADRDFIPVTKLLSKRIGTKFFSVAPPKLRGGRNLTSSELINNPFSQFISAFGLPERVYYAPESIYPGHLSKLKLMQSGPSGRPRIRERRQEIRSQFVNNLLGLIESLKVQYPPAEESQILA